MPLLGHDAYTLAWDNYEQSRASSLQSLWESQDFLDVTIACDDDQMEAHKVVLSAASHFFKNILKRNPHSHPLLYLRGTTKTAMKYILEFIYSGETRVIKEELENFMDLAKSLQVKGLCEDTEDTHTKDDFEEFATSDEPILEEENYSESSRKTSKEHKKEIRRGKKCTKELTAIKDIDVADSKYESANHMLDIATPSFLEPEKSEETYKFESNDFLNTSIDEYEEKVVELVEKTETGWKCRQCHYERNKSGHVSEHVEKHITGFLLSCNLCDRTFTKKNQIRHHKSKYHKPTA